MEDKIITLNNSRQQIVTIYVYVHWEIVNMNIFQLHSWDMRKEILTITTC